jgi:hypothetical protein
MAWHAIRLDASKRHDTHQYQSFSIQNQELSGYSTSTFRWLNRAGRISWKYQLAGSLLATSVKHCMLKSL